VARQAQVAGGIWTGAPFINDADSVSTQVGGSVYFVGTSAEIPVVPEVRPYPGPAGKSRRGRKPHRSVVEIDGEMVAVTGRAEASALLENVKRRAEAEAPKAAKAALNRAREEERKTGVLPAIYLEPLRVESVDGTVAFAAEVERINAAVAKIYERAIRDAEIALLARRAAFERDEDDAMAMLLLH